MRFQVGSKVKLAHACWFQPKGLRGIIILDDGSGTMPYRVRFSKHFLLWLDGGDLELDEGTKSHRTFYVNRRKRHISKYPAPGYETKVRAVTLELAYRAMEDKNWRK